MCSGAEYILTAKYLLWQVSPRSDGSDSPAPAGQNLGTGLLVKALAHLHERDLARSKANDKILPMAGPDYTKLFQREGLESPASQARRQNPKNYALLRSNFC